jgi:hypothetical protein
MYQSSACSGVLYVARYLFLDILLGIPLTERHCSSQSESVRMMVSFEAAWKLECKLHGDEGLSVQDWTAHRLAVRRTS